MSQPWYSLFVPTEDAPAVVDALQSAHTALGYEPYDPFPGGRGARFRRWETMARLFVAPSADGWTQAIGYADPVALPAVVEALPLSLLDARLADDEQGLWVVTAQGRQQDADAFVPWLRPDQTLAHFAAVQSGKVRPDRPDDGESASLMGVALPDGVNPRRAEKMMNRFSRRFLRDAGGVSQQDEAKALLAAGQPLWDTPAGHRLYTLLSCLTVPDGWRAPSYEDLSEAYQVARARQHNPQGLRLPGDDAALAAVPNALDYTPVFLGKR